MSEIYLNQIKKLKNSYKVSIRCDNDSFDFVISDDLLIRLNFLKPKKLSDSEYKALLNSLPYDSIFLDGLKYATRKRRTIKEIKEHLREKTSSDELIQDVINDLSKRNILNDEDYLNSYLEYAIYYKRDGYLKIVNDLMERGISKPFNYPIDQLKENIEVLTKKFVLSSKDMNKDLRIMKAKLYLKRRGYTDDDISKYFNSSLVSEGTGKKTDIRTKSITFRELKNKIK